MQGLRRLVEERLVLEFGQWVQGDPLPEPIESFSEAERCVDWIVDKWQLDT